jgi:hypothetical protein
MRSQESNVISIQVKQWHVHISNRSQSHRPWRSYESRLRPVPRMVDKDRFDLNRPINHMDFTCGVQLISRRTKKQPNLPLSQLTMRSGNSTVLLRTAISRCPAMTQQHRSGKNFERALIGCCGVSPENVAFSENNETWSLASTSNLDACESSLFEELRSNPENKIQNRDHETLIMTLLICFCSLHGGRFVSCLLRWR